MRPAAVTIAVRFPDSTTRLDTVPPTRDDLLQPGFMVVHGNRLEDLRDLTATWFAHAPLAPLESDVVLVQSNGIAQWFKQALARPHGDGGLGISAAVDMQLPGRFLWQAYRAVLGGDKVPAGQSPFDPDRLVWRLLRVLPRLPPGDVFAPLREWLRDDADGRRRHALAIRLADLFDQYQVHRGDWLDDWQQRRDVLADALRGTTSALPAPQRWQPALWRALLDDIGAPRRDSHRAAVHRRFLHACSELTQRPAALPRRVVVFGISSLPFQTMEALAALGRLSQVLLVVMNPCRQYWADLIDGRELLLAERRRHGSDVAVDVNAAGHPLLAAWGKQGRDTIRLLDHFDVPADYRHRFAAIDRSIDLFDANTGDHLIGQLQRDILDLRGSSTADGQRELAADERSIRFHVAHGAQREVEILHDQLLALRDQAECDGRPLQPRDIVVMVPKIEDYAPHVEAVFGRYGRDDPRYLPWSIADRPQRGGNPLLVALEALLALPDGRCTASDLLGLLDAPALRRRFGIGDDELPLLRRWIVDAGVRWGLHAAQREHLGVAGDINSWAFGLRRMLLGYAVGDAAAWQGIEPYDEIGGLDARLVGALARLLERIDGWWRGLDASRPPAEWTRWLRALLADAFDAGDDRADALLLDRLDASLEAWSDACADAALVEPLPRAIVADAWLGELDRPQLSQRFGSGAINFATLMPMRAIPFRVVCLLGMNDGDYPRQRIALDFDLMAHSGTQRPGDRSRRDDDRYLFLEALLSVRDHLHLSWVGRSVRDNEARPPSVLVGQLRDHIAATWRLPGDADGKATLAALTTEHPLQPFSRSLFDGANPALFSYASEWRDALQVDVSVDAVADAVPVELADRADGAPIRLDALARLLRHPVRTFFAERLRVHFDDSDDHFGDDEPFDIDALQRWAIGDELLRAADAAGAEIGIDRETDVFAHAAQRLRARGALPLHADAVDELQPLIAQASSVHERRVAERDRWPVELPVTGFRMAHDGVVVDDDLDGLRVTADVGDGNVPAVATRLSATAGVLLDKKQALKWHRIVADWPAHLAANASGQPTRTCLIAADAVIELPAIDAADADALLRDLLVAWQRALKAPPPLDCKAAFAWLQSEQAGNDAEALARKAFDDDYSRDASRQRAWPDFDAMLDGGFVDALAIYRPLFEHARLEGGAA